MPKGKYQNSARSPKHKYTPNQYGSPAVSKELQRYIDNHFKNCFLDQSPLHMNKFLIDNLSCSQINSLNSIFNGHLNVSKSEETGDMLTLCTTHIGGFPKVCKCTDGCRCRKHNACLDGDNCSGMHIILDAANLMCSYCLVVKELFESLSVKYNYNERSKCTNTSCRAVRVSMRRVITGMGINDIVPGQRERFKHLFSDDISKTVVDSLNKIREGSSPYSVLPMKVDKIMKYANLIENVDKLM